GTVTNKHEYTYNTGNQRTQQTFTDGSTHSYTYDSIGQLKVANSSVNSEDRGYSYDTAWNLGFRTNSGWTDEFDVDDRNQLTLGDSYMYDDNGNFRNGGDWWLDYDAENQLIGASYFGPDSHSDLVYDGLGRLRKIMQYQWNDTE